MIAICRKVLWNCKNILFPKIQADRKTLFLLISKQASWQRFKNAKKQVITHLNISHCFLEEREQPQIIHKKRESTDIQTIISFHSLWFIYENLRLAKRNNNYYRSSYFLILTKKQIPCHFVLTMFSLIRTWKRKSDNMPSLWNVVLSWLEISLR